MNKEAIQYTIILFYKYTEIENPEKLQKEQLSLCTKLGLKGRVIVAKEGINTTLEGTNENIEKYLKEYLSDYRFTDTHIKKSQGTGNAFPKLKVKVRPEIVTLGLEEDINPNQITGKKLKSEELKQWYESGKKFKIIDMRNDYEFKVGRFKDSIMPDLQNFRDLSKELSKIEEYKDEAVLTVCTGGVRCEKASGLLVREGFKDVYQLDGGIVTYMEKFPAQEFEGTLYVFDGRITMDFDTINNLREKHKIVGKCEKCDALSERYVNCKNPMCNKHFICCEECDRATSEEVLSSAERMCSESDGKSFCSNYCRELMTSLV